MTDDATVRAVLREHGETVPARGKLSAAHHARYEELTNHPAGPVPGDDSWGDDPWDGADDDGDIITGTIPAADTPAADAGDDDGDGGGASSMTAEQRPRRPRAKSRPRLADRLAARLGAGKPAAKTKAKAKSRPKHARIPVDRIISRGWNALSRVALTVSTPVATTLALQAPVAGLICEDMVRNTVVDTVLQPVARAEERGEKVLALAGPPLIVAAIERAQGLEEPARSIRLAILEPMLVESLGLWVKIAGDKIETAAARLEEDRATREEVQRLIALIFPQATVEDMTPDDAGVMAGAGM